MDALGVVVRKASNTFLCKSALSDSSVVSRIVQEAEKQGLERKFWRVRMSAVGVIGEVVRRGEGSRELGESIGVERERIGEMLRKMVGDKESEVARGASKLLGKL